ncbi:MAG: DUF1987 domain-containing protein [Flavobacteriales bacterium]|jgi:hypothetical protein|nr:DUF1987 domain-containing protein [Flavobacteriales bacterium]
MEDGYSYGFENVEIPATANTPAIILNKDEGIIDVRGLSIPENTREFYYHFNRWLTEYSFHPAKRTQVTIALQYMNSSSSVVITRLIMLLDEMIGIKSEVRVKWFYERDDIEMKEQGEYYRLIMKIPIDLVEVETI